MLTLLLHLVIWHVAHALPAGRLHALQADLALDRLEGMMERRLVFHWLAEGSKQTDKDGVEHDLGGTKGSSLYMQAPTVPAADFTQQPAAFREECARLHQQALAAINAAWESRWGAVERAIDAAREEQRKADAGDEDALTTEVAASNIEAALTTEYVEAKREKDAMEAFEPDSYCVPYRVGFSDDVRKLTQTTANALNEAGAVQAGAGYYMFVERADGAVFLTGPDDDGGEYGHTTNFDAYDRVIGDPTSHLASPTWYIDADTKIVMAGWMSIDDTGTMVAYDAASGHFIPDANDVQNSQLIKERFCGHNGTPVDNPLDKKGKPRQVIIASAVQEHSDNAAEDLLAACSPFDPPRQRPRVFRF